MIIQFSLTFSVCSKFPDFSVTGKCFPIFPVRVRTLTWTKTGHLKAFETSWFRSQPPVLYNIM